MMLTILVAIALVIERFVQIIKPLWGEAMVGKLSVTAIVSIALGIAVCVLVKLSITAAIPVVDELFVGGVRYVLYVFTGAAVGSGASFVHDLWTKLNNYTAE